MTLVLSAIIWHAQIQVWADPAPAPAPFDSQIMQIQPFFWLYLPLCPIFFTSLDTRSYIFTNPESIPTWDRKLWL